MKTVTKFCPNCQRDTTMMAYQTRWETWYTCDFCISTPYIEVRHRLEKARREP